MQLRECVWGLSDINGHLPLLLPFYMLLHVLGFTCWKIELLLSAYQLHTTNSPPECLVPLSSTAVRHCCTMKLSLPVWYEKNGVGHRAIAVKPCDCIAVHAVLYCIDAEADCHSICCAYEAVGCCCCCWNCLSYCDIASLPVASDCFS